MAHILAAMGANVFAVAVVGFTIVIGRVTDEVILPGLSGEGPAVSGRTVLSGMAALGIVGLVRGLSIMVRRWFNMMAVARTQRTWRQSLTDRYLDAPMSFHWERPAGQLLAHADADVEVATSMLMPLAFSVSVVALIVVSLISLLVVHPLFALVALVLFPTLAVLNRRFTKSIEAPAARAQAEVGRVSSIAHESLDGVLVVKTLGRQDQEVARFAEAAAALREERIAVGRLRANYSPIIYSLPNLGMGEMVRAMALFSILSLPMEILGFLFQMIPQSVVAQDRINKVLAVDPESTVVGGEVGSAIVDFVGLSFAYPTDGPQAPLVLENLSLHIDPGETVALVGSTGAGKSTLVALLAALMPPTEGQVLLGGVDVQDLGSEGTAAVVAPVFQETFLFADSVRQNLTLGRDIPEGELQRVLALVEAERFVSEMPQGIDTVVGERGVTLSGGQRQRLAIARGLLRRPKVLVLDDATSAVDPTIEAAILANLRAHGGRTLLVVAHRLATIRLADRVLFLEGGRIAAQGTHEELLAVPAYAALAQAYEKAGS